MSQDKAKVKKGGQARGGAGSGAGKAASGRAGAVAEVLSRREPLANTQRTAFHRLFAAAQCDAMGARTKSAGVVKDAVAWVPIIDKALGRFPAELRRYGQARFAWLLECILALVDARAAQQADGDGVPAARTNAARARAAAKDAQGELVDALETLGEQADLVAQALAAPVGAVSEDEALVSTVGAVASLARAWLSKSDAESKALVASVGLTLGEIESAENAAAELGAAIGAKALAGRLDFRDSPAVNRAEGRVLLEMRTAMRLFASAHDKNKLVPKLVPGPATRHVLGRKAAGQAAEAAPGEPAPPAPDNAPQSPAGGG
jgi:hypothetical protein